MEINYTNTFTEVFYSRLRGMAKNPVALFISIGLLLFIAVDSFRSQWETDHSTFVKIATVLIVVLFWFGFLVIFDLIAIYLSSLYLHFRSDREGLYGPRTLKFNSNSISEVTSINSGEWAWSKVHSLTRDKRFIYLYVSPEHYFLIPNRALSSDPETVFNELKSMLTSSKGAA